MGWDTKTVRAKIDWNMVANNDDNVPVPNNARLIEGPRIPCLSCQGLEEETCPWDELGQEILDHGQEMVDSGSTPPQVRFNLYRLATSMIHGYLGRSNRKELPACVEDSIKEAFPNSAIGEGGLVGFRPAPQAHQDEWMDLEYIIILVHKVAAFY
jgi:hypothetical protein